MDKPISLIPFLESGNEGFCLEIPISDPVDDGVHGDFRPFQVVENGQCFSMIVKATLKMSHAASGRSLFLLVQRDHYPVFSNGFRTVTNADMDRIWRDTIQSSSADKSGFWSPDSTCFTPLFFCRHKKLFFHPPCPECGGLLDICRDDRLLKKAALFSYHATLKRYLFCSQCQAAGEKTTFYQFSRSPEDRVFVKDRFDLIRDFKRLRNDASKTFPCLFCHEHAQCYITDEKALSRISFFSFYPFYMLVFDAAVVKGVDFIPLLSGAGIQKIPALKDTVPGAELDAGLAAHGGSGFLFENQDRFFLEVLYLKLSFIEKFVRMLKQKVDNHIRSVVNLSVHSIWLTPRNQGSMLPFFWGFDLNIIDLVSNRQEDGGGVFQAGNRNIEFLAGLWFYTFLVNRIQGHNEVFGGLRQLSGNSDMTGDFSDYTQMVQAYSFLAAENIFWNPEQKTVPEHWQPFWLLTMALGLRFLQPHSQDLKTEIDSLLADMERVKQTVKTRLFSVQEAGENRQTVPKSNSADQEIPSEILSRKQAIRSLLIQLREKWRAEHQVEDITGNQDVRDEDVREEDVLETIVLSSSDRKAPETISDSGSDFEDMEKTVVLTPNDKGDSEDADSEKTGKHDDRFFDEDDDLDKTVVISPEK